VRGPGGVDRHGHPDGRAEAVAGGAAEHGAANPPGAGAGPGNGGRGGGEGGFSLPEGSTGSCSLLPAPK
jgi:hypothetical protein